MTTLAGPTQAGLGTPRATPGDLEVDPRQNRNALLRLFIVVALGIAASVEFHFGAVLIVIAALIVMVMAHELGHFATAKLSGMKVTEYFLGFGPRLWSVRRGETEYGIKALPAGGYVRITGMTMLEEVAPQDEARSYRQATFPRRLLVAVAGSAVHFLLALGLLWGMLAFSGYPEATTAQITSFTTFSNVASPAKAAGFHVGDEFVSIDGQHFGLAQQYLDFIRDHADRNITVVVKRGNQDVTLHVRPIDGRTAKVVSGKVAVPVVPQSTKDAGVIGVEVEFLSKDVTTNPISAIGHAVTMLGSVTKGTALGIGQIFSPHGLGQISHQVTTAGSAQSSNASASSSANGPQLLSIVGAIQIGAQAAHQDISELLYILVAINIFVGMINLFPMLPLDGGHVAIAIYERARSRKGRSAYHADITKLMPVAYLFLAFVVILGLSALYVNIVQPASLPGG